MKPHKKLRLKIKARRVIACVFVLGLVLFFRQCEKASEEREKPYQEREKAYIDEFGALAEEYMVMFQQDPESSVSKRYVTRLFAPKVLVYAINTDIPGYPWWFRNEDFAARKANDVGTVLIVRRTLKKVGDYVETWIRTRLEDALEVTYYIAAFDRQSKQVIARHRIVAEPPKYDPPSAGEERADSKAKRQLLHWIRKHLQDVAAEEIEG